MTRYPSTQTVNLLCFLPLGGSSRRIKRNITKKSNTASWDRAASTQNTQPPCWSIIGGHVPRSSSARHWLTYPPVTVTQNWIPPGPPRSLTCLSGQTGSSTVRKQAPLAPSSAGLGIVPSGNARAGENLDWTSPGGGSQIVT